ncbi:hypothetical protein [Actinokineospora enzanensis]|uniref:hypothetical protein n=1 Tax=Actinokineospora enzanensis TaxID=155975 RepID=UPI00035CE4F3|nr:hypothetical protein [Actinokineospora enzanensis]
MDQRGERADRAQESYLPLLDLCEAAYERLGSIADPAARAALLTALADNIAAASEMYEVAFRTVDGQHAVDQAMGMATDSRLARVLAEVETARVSGTPRPHSGWSEVEAGAGGLLDRLADPTVEDHGQRAELYADLYRAVRGVLAGPAAGEVLQRLEQSHLDLAGREAADRVS